MHFRFSNSIVYFGISLYLPMLSKNPFLNFFISGMVEFPGYLVAQLTIAYLGRKWPLFFVMSVTSLCLYILVGIESITAGTSNISNLSLFFSGLIVLLNK